MSNDVAYLINKTYSQDSIGQTVAQETREKIYVEERSVTRDEWTEAGRLGLNPSIKLSTPSVNYSGQKEVEYKNIRYSVYRTYIGNDRVELYLEKKGGVNG